MLNKLGFMVSRYRWPIIGVWIIAAILITVLSPKLSSVTSSDQTSFLPDKYQSVQAQKIASEAFPQSKDDVEILLVQRQDGSKLTSDDQTRIQSLADQLAAAKLTKVVAVQTSAQALSKDGTAQTIQIIVSGQATGGTEDVTFVKTIRDRVKSLIAGSDLTTGLTGQISLNADSSSSFTTATKIVTLATFALVILLPGIIFRSPVAAFAPVLAVSLVYALAQSLIALAAKTFGFKISDQLSILYTVVLFGIGTDYILFLLFRYREKLREGSVPGREALSYALSRSGEAILSAALVVVAAFAALGFSDFGLFKNLAPGLVICVLSMLCAILTLIPAVIAVIGPKIFWPSKAWQTHPSGTVSKKVGRIIARRPAIVAGGAFIVLILLATGYPQLKTNYDFVSQQPQSTESAQAYKQVSELFSAGAISPTNVYVTSHQAFSQDQLATLSAQAGDIPNATLANPAVASKDGKTAQLTFLLKGNAESTGTLDYVNDTFEPAAQKIGTTVGADHVYVGGESASFADVRSAVSRDLAVILPVAAVIIFIILVALLKSFLAPLYLLIAVALGFTATLGGTVYLFQNLLGQAGLIFFIPIMVYIFVVAIGTDYNILTMVRLREEVRAGNKPRQAADLTLEHSGATVASAGIILAGTFGSLALAGISLLAQLGFAVAFGIMLSAFVIATLLVPSVAALLGYKIWWPGHRPARDKNRL